MPSSERTPTRVIALINQKGGVGKTTTTVNLGAAIAQLGRRTLLIDLDPQAHLTLHLGIERDPDAASVYDVLVDPACDPREAVVEARPNLHVIPSVVDLAAAESELADDPERNRILARRLSTIIAEHEFVLLDCPPSLGLLTLNALCLAKEVFVTMQAHFLALQGVGKLLETVGLVARSVNPNLRVTGVVLCMHEANISHQREVVADLDAFFEQARGGSEPWSGCRVLRPPIRRNIKLAEAPSFGQSVLDYAPWCPGALDYRKLADRVVADWDAMLARRRGAAPGSARAGSPGSASPGSAHTGSASPAAEGARSETQAPDGDVNQAPEHDADAVAADRGA